MSNSQKKLTIIGGPCVIESYEGASFIAERLKKYCDSFGFNFVFKASFDKANRSDIASFRGPGLEKGLAILKQIKEELEVKITSDIHETIQAEAASEVLDIIQIPAFLCRQTSLLEAAASFGKTVNVKKGQFLPHIKVKQIVEKLKAVNPDLNVLITDRGNMYGYTDYIVDFPSLIKVSNPDFTKCLDITHPTQQISYDKKVTQGDYEKAFILARCGVVNAISHIFLETHPDPVHAESDQQSMIPLHKIPILLSELAKIQKAIH